MLGQDDSEPKTLIMPSCKGWIYRNGANFADLSLSDSSFYLNNTASGDEFHYAYASNNLTYTYRSLVGKTIVVEFFVSGEALTTFAIASRKVASGGGGISGLNGIKTFASNSIGHVYREIQIGTDYVNSNTNYYITVVFQAKSLTSTSKSIITNFKCYVKGE